LLRLDEDRLTDLQLQPGQESPFVCTRRAGLWRCNDRALAAVAQHALLAALHALERGESPTYEAAPAAPPRWVLQLRHSPLSTAPTKTSAGGPAVEAGEEVAPQEQTLRLYPAADGGLVARLDARGVSYRLPPAAATALQESLAAWRSAQP
jgi:hypothetical protein